MGGIVHMIKMNYFSGKNRNCYLASSYWELSETWRQLKRCCYFLRRRCSIGKVEVEFSMREADTHTWNFFLDISFLKDEIHFLEFVDKNSLSYDLWNVFGQAALFICIAHMIKIFYIYDNHSKSIKNSTLFSEMIIDM